MARTQYQNGIAAAHLIDESGIIDIVLAAVRKPGRGRPPNVKALRLYLIGWLLAIHTERMGTVEAAWQALDKLDVGQKLTIGFHEPRHEDDWIGVPVVSLKMLYRWSEIVGRELAYALASAGDLDEATRAERADAVQRIVTAGLGVFREWWSGDIVTLDATGVHSWGRPPYKADMEALKREHAELIGAIEPEDVIVDDDPDSALDAADDARRAAAHDPDALWALKTKPSGNMERFYGYFAHVFVLLVGAKIGKAPVDPTLRLVIGLEVTPASSRKVIATTVRLLDRLPIRVRTVIADRLYSHSKVEDWRDVLAERGIDPIFDLRKPDHGIVHINGIPYVDGDFFCPGMPQKYGTLIKPAPNEPPEAHATFRAAIAAREPFRARRVTQMNDKNKIRIQCPAREGKIGCPLLNGSVQVAISLGQRIVENPPDTNSPEGLCKLCTQETVQVELKDKQRKIHQILVWANKLHNRIYGWRTHSEGVFGQMKNQSNENLNRGIFRISGVARVNLTVLFAAMSYNLRSVRTENERTRRYGDDHPLFRPAAQLVAVAVPADLDTTVVAHPATDHATDVQAKRSA